MHGGTETETVGLQKAAAVNQIQTVRLEVFKQEGDKNVMFTVY